MNTQKPDTESPGDAGTLVRLRSFLRFSSASSEQQGRQSARLLHDELQSYLVAAKFDLSWIRSNSIVPADAPIQIRWLNALDCLEQAIAICRQVVERLRPSLVANLGLLPALQWMLTETMQRTDLHIQQEFPSEIPELHPCVALKAYRIAEHSLVFLLSHHDVSVLTASMKFDADQLTMRFAAKVNGQMTSVSDPAARTQLEIDHEEIHDRGGFVLLRDSPGREIQVTSRIPLTFDGTEVAPPI